jgi:hypothetical protein
MTSSTAPKTSPAFCAQAAISFGIALFAVVAGTFYLPVGGWVRAFLALGTLFLVSSSFTLAKCVRDQQESGAVLSRLDEARLEKLLAEYDPYAPHLPSAPTVLPFAQNSQS